MIGHTGRMDYIEKAIERKQCIITKDSVGITGFLIYDTYFFEHCFISLIIVSPSKRRMGYASLLINYMKSISPTIKIYSSTNRSNTDMQKVFEVNRFIQSGIVENLDEGDPEIIYFTSKEKQV